MVDKCHCYENGFCYKCPCELCKKSYSDKLEEKRIRIGKKDYDFFISMPVCSSCSAIIMKETK